MCGIFASESLDEFKKLLALNSVRGNQTSSITYVNKKTYEVISINRFIGLFTIVDIKELNDCYYIGHVQIPTGNVVEDLISRSHPSDIEDGASLLWHNGQLNQTMHEEYGIDKWDTNILHEVIYDGNIDQVKGTFACMLFDAVLNFVNIFRNSAGVLYMNGTSVSSIHLDGYILIGKNITYTVNWGIGFTEVGKFNNTFTPYYIPTDASN
jgi:hypothetical protein